MKKDHFYIVRDYELVWNWVYIWMQHKISKSPIKVSKQYVAYNIWWDDLWWDNLGGSKNMPKFYWS